MPTSTSYGARSRRVDRHGRGRVHRHAGSPAGKTAPRRVLLRGDGRGAPRRGLQLPARTRHGDGPGPGLQIASWERGYGDFALAPDLGTLRRVPWLEATALVLCDVNWHDGTPVQPSPRQVLKAQMERARGARPHADDGVGARVLPPARDLPGGAGHSGTEDLTPSVPYILDYHILATTYDEDLIRQIRNGMQGRASGSRRRRARRGRASTRSTSASPTR